MLNFLPTGANAAGKGSVVTPDDLLSVPPPLANTLVTQDFPSIFREGRILKQQTLLLI